ncbi:MAG TPA: ATP-binding protein, partial [Vicinamibacterales bacterium]|nr:ATP-binding protein [Vicinamibacterales bacterium]
MSFAAVIERLRTLANPYPGLRPFETAESHLFFGRDQQVAELVARLERNRFLAVVGLSGSGKSSLVRAGLIPALERGRVLEAGRRWRIVVTRPGAAPFQSLSSDLASAGLDPAPLTRSSHGLIEVAQQLSPDESLLVVVDQFEELFRYKDVSIASPDARERRDGSAADAAEFVQLLLEASRQPRPVYVVITMRSDYLGDCAEFRDLPETLNDCQYLVPRMTREQRKEAIEVPLGQVAIAPSLVQRLLNDAGDEPDQLPVLQHALMRTWHRWRRDDPERARRIEPADYAEIGGFEQAIDQHAEEVLAGVDAAIAERIFKRLTARGRGNRERRDPATFGDLCAICGADTADARTRVAAVVDAFRRGDATFLTPRDGALSGATYVDITHESLIRHWRRLRDTWLPEEQQSAKTFLTLAERARSWEAGRAEPLSGLDLRDAQQWERQRNPAVAWARHYGDANDLDLVLRFIGASKIHDRNLRLRKRGLLIAAPLAIVFAGLAIFAITQASRARELGRVSLSRQLAARSQVLLAESANLQPSVLLAVEALRRAPGADAEQALRRSMAR